MMIITMMMKIVEVEVVLITDDCVLVCPVLIKLLSVTCFLLVMSGHCLNAWLLCDGDEDCGGCGGGGGNN